MKAYPIQLPVEELMIKSRKISGIDIIDRDAVEPLSILLASYNEEACLLQEGAIETEKALIRILCNRLRMHRDFAAHPEIEDQIIKGPLLVYGLARSGTTKTQKVLSTTRDFNWLPFWQVLNPSLITGNRNESPEPRIQEAEELAKWFAKRSPDYLLAHPFQTHEPEEDIIMGAQYLIAPTFGGFAEVPSFLQWLADHDVTEYFKFIRDALKYLQWQGFASESKRWLLKAPGYVGAEVEMLKVFPDTQFVMTHRDPMQTIPSVFRLLDTFHEPFSNLKNNYQNILLAYGTQLKQHMANRRILPDLSIVDILFDELNSSAESSLEKIYRFLDMSFSDASRQEVRNWELDNPRHKNGVLQYSLEDYNVTEAQIEQALADYIEFIKSLIEN